MRGTREAFCYLAMLRASSSSLADEDRSKALTALAFIRTNVLGTQSLLDAFLERWEAAGRPNSLPEALFPRTAARLCLMWERLVVEGFTSFWI